MALSLVTVPLTLGYLGPERYGMWLTISSLIALLAFSDLGIGNGLLNAVTRSLARGDANRSRREISSALALLAVLAGALALLFVVLYPFIQWERVLAVTSQKAASEAGPAMAAWMACLLFGLPLSVATQVRLGRQEGYVANLANAIGNVAAVCALLVVIQTHQGVPVLVIAMAGPPLVATAVNGLWLFARDSPNLRPSRSDIDLRAGLELLRSGSLFFLIQLAMAVAFTSDTIVIAQLVGPKAVAEYGVASKLFLIPAGLVAIALSPLWPAYGEAITRGDVPWVRSTLERSLKVALLISVPASVILVLLGLPIIRIWVGVSVSPPFFLILGLGIWVILGAAGNAVAMLLNGAHEIRLQAAAAVIMAAANLGVSIWLTSRFGVAGVIWGTVIAYGLFVLVPMAIYVPRVLTRIQSQDNRI